MLGASPPKVMDPLVPPQVVGLLPVADVITGVGFTVTFTGVGRDAQPCTEVVALYTPLMATVAFVRVAGVPVPE